MDPQPESSLTWPTVPGSEEENRAASLGPYQLNGTSVFGPGISLHEARGENSERVLLQEVTLEKCDDPEIRDKRAAYQARLVAEVERVSKKQTNLVLDQGHADDESGRRRLYFVLPWPADLGDDSGLLHRPKSWVEVALVGQHLAQQLADAHAKERCQPQLTEGALVFAADRRSARWSGLPVVIRSEWLTAETPVSRLAPEEEPDEAIGRRGDIWRLGRTLRALGEPLGTPPIELATLLRAMVQDDPQRRLRRATDVARELEAISAVLAKGAPGAEAEPTRQESASGIGPVDEEPAVPADVTIKSGELVIEEVRLEAPPEVIVHEESDPAVAADLVQDMEEAEASAPPLGTLPSGSVEARWFASEVASGRPGQDAAPAAASLLVENDPGSSPPSSPPITTPKRRRRPRVTAGYWIARGLLGVAAGAALALMSYLLA